MDESENNLIVCELTSNIGTRKICVKLPILSTVNDLIEKVADRYSKPKEFFSLYFILDSATGSCESEITKICLNDMGNQRLESFLPDIKQDVANFLIQWHPDNTVDTCDTIKNLENVEKIFLNRGILSPEIISPKPISTPLLQQSPANHLPDSSSPGLVGLVNQAMTCYLNSLLQSLFMTPEFRNAVYRWKFTGSYDEGLTSIPFQLQRLFLQLQTSKKRSVPTINITQSFGWDNSEAWHQHDVQELCRVMFDALEKTWSDTDQANLINELYQGKMKDFIQCSECGWESTKYVPYQDIPLVVKPFGSNRSYASVEESLDGFCAPELLDGNNQWFCERCQKKVDAKKCLKFKTFPYILTLHLMRFSFDYATMRRIKLNNRMTFPELLNLGCYVTEDGLSKESVDGLSKELANTHFEADHERGDSNVLNGHRVDNDSQDQLDYELFSIMIHSGNATGGHYYAYIRSFETGQWYNFDDQSVTRINHDEIYKTFGGSSLPCNYYLPIFASSTNAYMVMYRRIDKKRNADFMKVEEFPSYLKEELAKIEEEEEMMRMKQENEKSSCKIRIFVHHPLKNKLVESLLVINIYKTLKEATYTSWKLFELEDVVTRDCVRLVQYDSEQDYIEQSFDQFEEESTTIFELLGGSRSWYAFDLLLELKMPGELFQAYHLGEWVVKVFPVDLSREEILPNHIIRVNSHVTVAEVCNLAVAKINFLNYTNLTTSEEEIRFINEASNPCQLEDSTTSIGDVQDSTLVEYSGINDSVWGNEKLQSFPTLVLQIKNDFKLLEDPQKQIKNEGFTKISKLYIEFSKEGDSFCEDTFIGSKLHKFLYQQHNCITIKVCLENCAHCIEGVTPKNRFHLESYERDAKDGDNHDKENKSPSLEGDYGNGTSLEGTVVSTRGDFGSEGESNTECTKYKDSFKVHPMAAQPWSCTKECTVTFDRRMKVKTFKGLIQPHVGIQEFELYKVLAATCPDERLMRHFENFTSLDNNSQIRLKAGRDLKKNEFILKLYHLDINKAEMSNFLYEFILLKGTVVTEVKQLLSNVLRERDKINVPPDCIRLRKKIWKNPTAVFDDEQKFNDADLFVTYNSEVFVQLLKEPDPPGDNKRFIFIRRWWPSKYQLGPVQEIITKKSILDFINKVSEVSNINAENVQIAKVSGMFPNDTPLLDIHCGLVWMPHRSDETCPSGTALESLDIYSDGTMFYYRDRTEDLKQLSQEERGLIMQKYKVFPFSSIGRKEKALKIYTDTNTSNLQVNNSPS